MEGKKEKEYLYGNVKPQKRENKRQDHGFGGRLRGQSVCLTNAKIYRIFEISTGPAETGVNMVECKPRPEEGETRGPVELIDCPA